MTGDELRSSISGWCSGNDGFEYLGDQGGEGDYSGRIRALFTEGDPVELQVLQDPGRDRIIIRHSAPLSGLSAKKARDLFDARPGWIRGRVDNASGTDTGVVDAFVYHDGLNKNSFLLAAAEVAHTARLSAGATAAEATLAGTATPVDAVAAGARTGAQPVPAPSFQPAPNPQAQQPQPWQPQPQPQYQPQPQPQYQPQPQPQPQSGGAWAPTHSVPPQGLRAWAAPDPNGPVVANLAPGLPIQVAEVRGAWARVVCSNGWVGWVDGRIIGVAA